MIVDSSSLGGPTEHRPADSAWIEASVERRVKPTGADNHPLRLTVRRVPGGARPGRWTGAPSCRRRTGDTPSQSEGQHLTGGQSATVKGSEGRTINVHRVDSQAILSERRGPSEGGLPGSARRDMQGAAEALVDSRTRRIVPGGEWRTTALGAGRRAGQSCVCTSDTPLKVAAYLEGVEDGLCSCVCVSDDLRDKHVCRRRRGKECERLGVSTSFLSSVFVVMISC